MDFCAFNLLQIWIDLKFFPLLVSATQVLHILSWYVLMLRPVFSCQLFDGQFWPVPLLKLRKTDISTPLQIGSFFFFFTVWGKLFLTGSSYIFVSFVRLINATASSLGCLKYLEERKNFMHIFAAELDLVELLLEFWVKIPSEVPLIYFGWPALWRIWSFSIKSCQWTWVTLLWAYDNCCCIFV